jgi:hypothetical protein
MHSERLGGVADIALVFEKHLLDVFPLDAADRQRLSATSIPASAMCAGTRR